MNIRNALKSIDSIPGRWVRLEEIRRMPGGLELCFAIRERRRGRKIDAWSIGCLGIYEAKFSELDQGGLSLYSTTHSAARQYTARRAALLWRGGGDQDALLGAFYRAHTDTVDDWIPFDRYSKIEALPGNRLACRGPDFLMRAYAKAAWPTGEQPRLALLRNRTPKYGPPKVLHFGDSYVVAARFTASNASSRVERG